MTGGGERAGVGGLKVAFVLPGAGIGELGVVEDVSQQTGDESVQLNRRCGAVRPDWDRIVRSAAVSAFDGFNVEPLFVAKVVVQGGLGDADCRKCAPPGKTGGHA